MHIRITFSLNIKNIFIHLIFPNMITYSERTFKEVKNDINFK